MILTGRVSGFKGALSESSLTKTLDFINPWNPEPHIDNPLYPRPINPIPNPLNPKKGAEEAGSLVGSQRPTQMGVSA